MIQTRAGATSVLCRPPRFKLLCRPGKAQLAAWNLLVPAGFV